MSESCCCGEGGCCPPKQEKKCMIIDFLYLDLTVCERCQGTESNLEEAIHDVSSVLNAAGFEIILNKVNITTRELAVQYAFISSPTIRMNGKDIALDVKETLCEDCGDLCGDTVDCRVWNYEGIDYNTPPKALIVNAILKEIYGGHTGVESPNEYVMPQNLEVFFNGKEKK